MLATAERRSAAAGSPLLVRPNIGSSDALRVTYVVTQTNGAGTM